MKTEIFRKILKRAIPIFVVLCFGRLESAEIFVERGDTFISERNPDSEYSKSDYLIVSNAKGSRHYAYLPLDLDPARIGIFPASDKISDATLVLYYKSSPGETKSDAAESLPKEIKSEGEAKKVVRGDVEETAGENSLEKAGEKSRETDGAHEKVFSEHQDEDDVIEVLGITDSEHFEEMTERFRYSWNGKRNAIAPKHDISSGNLEKGGIAKLGEIRLKAGEPIPENGSSLEFSTPELEEWLSYCLGILSNRNISPKFDAQLDKLRHAVIILRKTSGSRDIIFHSSDSLEESFQNPRSGDIAKESEIEEANSPDAPDFIPGGRLPSLRELEMEGDLKAARKAAAEGSFKDSEGRTFEEVPDLRPRVRLDFKNAGGTQID